MAASVATGIVGLCERLLGRSCHIPGSTNRSAKKDHTPVPKTPFLHGHNRRQALTRQEGRPAAMHIAGCGTFRTWRLRLVMSVHRCQAEIICSLRVFRILTPERTCELRAACRILPPAPLHLIIVLAA